MVLPKSPCDSSSGNTEQRPHEDEELLSRLAREMTERWQRGEQVPAEEFLNRCPELWTRSDAALRLIYEEICLRQDHGQANAALQVMERFPQWRSELRLLLDCHRLLEPQGTGLPVLAAGQMVGDYQLVAELGRGGQGCVFLATQPALANRPVVLKFTTRVGQEHLALARLQHTHIVPLYAARDDPGQNLRMLCMPYLGGASLAHILHILRLKPSVEWIGQNLLTALDRLQAALPIAVPARGQVRSWLAQASYEQAICWMGACLADALQYAHERGLVHLDLSPANVLLTADGQPMLLDFHLAREPIQPGGPGPEWLGGTPGYMAPEQVQALADLRQGRPIACAVDARTDIYSLGTVLYESLGGPPPHDDPTAPRILLRRHNPRVSVGLSDVIARCLEPAPERRYPSAAELAEDMRRHLSGQPLRGVANRSPREWWSKWRRRHPYALTVGAALLAILTAALISLTHIRRQLQESQAAYQQGKQLVGLGQYAEAVEQVKRGRALASALPFPNDRSQAFDALLQQAQEGLAQQQREQTVAKLHAFVEQLRFMAVADHLPQAQERSLANACEQLWEHRQRILDPAGARLSPVLEACRHADFLDLSIIWSDLHVRQAKGQASPTLHREALRILTEAEQLYGASAALSLERRRHEQALGIEKPLPADKCLPRTAWEHLILGRSLMRSGQLEMARRELDRAVELDSRNFWGHFYQGIAAYQQGDARDAAQAFSVCAALAPRSGVCYYNRALAQMKLGMTDQAEQDFSRALELEPDLALSHRHTFPVWKQRTP